MTNTVSKHKIFDTKPKTWRHGNFISGDRCRVFMRQLWEKGLRKRASFPTLEYEFQQCFETNDKRTVIKYLGRPQQTVRYSAVSVVRMDRSSGKIANFEYHNKRKVDAKKGLLEILGYMTDLKNGYFKLNHEKLPYYTQQVTLPPSHSLPPRSSNECSSGFKDNLCACSIEAGENVEAYGVGEANELEIDRERKKKKI